MIAVNNTDVRKCKKCNILYRRGPHLFFATRPKGFEEATFSDCPVCKGSSTELASMTEEKNFGYLYDDDHGIADLMGQDSWMTQENWKDNKTTSKERII